MENLNNLNEEWRDIKDYEGFYQVSNYGRVKSLDRYDYLGRFKKEHIMREDISNNKYHRVMLSKNGITERYLVHRLVAFAFPEICGEWFEGAICNHKDENPENNYAWNIELCDYSYNNTYNKKSIKIGKKRSKPVLQYSLKGELIKEWDSVNSTKQFGYIPAHVSSCCRFVRRTHKGYIWRYK